MFGYPFPMWYGPPQQQGYQGGPTNDKFVIVKRKDLMKFAKLNGTKKEKKDEQEFIKVPVKKPSLYSRVQMFFILTALAPIIGPAYYLATIGSWTILKSGMMALLGN